MVLGAQKYGYSDFSINYLIELPASVDRFEINNDVGSIELNQLQGTFDISSDVGAITLRDVEVTGKSKVETDTGSIELSINEMKNSSSLKAKSDIGKISASLDSSLKCTVEASSELGHISGTGSGKLDLNGVDRYCPYPRKSAPSPYSTKMKDTEPNI